MRADKRLRGVALLDRHRRLHHDRAGVELRGHEVHRRARDLDAVRPRLVLGVESGEGRQQRRMHVQDRVGEGLDEGRRRSAACSRRGRPARRRVRAARRRWRDRTPRASRGPWPRRRRWECRRRRRARAPALRSGSRRRRRWWRRAARRRSPRRSPACCCRDPRSGCRDGAGQPRLSRCSGPCDRRRRCGRQWTRRSRRPRAARTAGDRRRRARRPPADPCPC